MVFNPEPFGNYLLIEKVSVGGMAEVFKAMMMGLEGFKKVTAIKRLLPSVAEDEEFARMFVDEANIAGQLHHANIAQIYDLGKTEGFYFIAMEYVMGRDLRAVFDRLKKIKRGVPLNMAVYIVAKACEGLDYAHRKKDDQGRSLNIVHRDISPPNILLSYEGEVKIVDFGIAKAKRKLTQTQAGILKGKFGYMSPEQVRGQVTDRRSDIFSLGIVLYEMVTGRRLFVGSSDFNTLEKVRNAEIRPPSEYNPHISEDLEAAIMKALDRDVERRYQWASEFQQDLTRYLYAQEHLYGPEDLTDFMVGIFKEDLYAERHRMEELEQRQNQGNRDSTVRSFQALRDTAVTRQTASAAISTISGGNGVPEQKPMGGLITGNDTPNLDLEAASPVSMVQPDRVSLMDPNSADSIELVSDNDKREAMAHTRKAEADAAAAAVVNPLPHKPKPTTTSSKPTAMRDRVVSPSSISTSRIRSIRRQVIDNPAAAAASSGPVQHARLDEHKHEPLRPDWFKVPPTQRYKWISMMAVLTLLFLGSAAFIASSGPFSEVRLKNPAGVQTASATFLSQRSNVAVRLIPVRDGKEDNESAIDACTRVPCHVSNVPTGVYRVEFRGVNDTFIVRRMLIEAGKNYPVVARFGEPGGRTGQLVLVSTPPEAEFTITSGNETIRQGVTPRVETDLPVGKRLVVTITRQGYTYDTRELMLEPFDVQKLETVLQSQKASLKITSIPPGAAIILDDLDTGKKTPAEFTDGISTGQKVSLQLKLDRYKPYIRTMELGGGINPVEAVLERPDEVAKAEASAPSNKPTAAPKPAAQKQPTTPAAASARSGGMLDVRSTPEGVQFKIKDSVAKAPARLKLPEGSYNLKVVIDPSIGLEVSCFSGAEVANGATTSCTITTRGGMYKCQCGDPK